MQFFTFHLGDHEFCTQQQDDIDGSSDDEIAESEKRPKKVSYSHAVVMVALFGQTVFFCSEVIAFGTRSLHEIRERETESL